MTNTICERWQSMLAAFANIKTAIAAMGVTISGGYAVYAQHIRKIYSAAAYTPKYTYPIHQDDAQLNIENQMTFCTNVMEEIRQAIIDGGVDVPTNTPLRDYADKILSISVVSTEPLRIVTTSLGSGRVGTAFTGKVEATGGQLPYTFTAVSGMPAGLELLPNGTVQGTPTMSGTYPYICIRVTDGAGTTVQKSNITLPIKTQRVNFTVTNNTYIYDGQPHSATVRPAAGMPKLVEGTDYTVTYGGEAQQTNAASYAIKVKLIGTAASKYNVGSVSPSTLQIQSAPITITARNTTVAYDGQPHKPEYTTAPEGVICNVFYEGANGTEYTKSQTEPAEIGTYKCEVYAPSNYEWQCKTCYLYIEGN